MRVERENNNSNMPQVLYHIQNMNICTDGEPFDTFVWSDHDLTEQDLEKIIQEEWENATDNEIDEFLTSSRIYPVYAEDIE